MRFARCLALALSCLCAWSAQAAGPAVGEAAPMALGKDRNGDAVDLSAYRGKIVVVTFWASWCVPCRHELPMLDDLQKQAGNDFLQVIAVNEDEDYKAYRAMLRQMKDFSLLLARDTGRAVFDQYDIRAYPNLWIIDPRGKVVAHEVGYGEGSFGEIVGRIREAMVREIEAQKAPGAAPASPPAVPPEPSSAT
jgi:thiol-disulfide isomerase/thioredoxin